ncbi:protein adenylyltransferase Fic [Mariniblastus fucicola]|uniref:Adenosine monophosphate-protein transferase SoFic n=1 Tax=Mariniblastus fucicola TaxID=980251 RepID=A0A5B9PPV6_9BACT|nr:Fic family protein [Mariniblastus fucicola]QEG24313.1 Adenosine monophosphate-protein transferase SoFic [Mariniblastus fucicola]
MAQTPKSSKNSGKPDWSPDLPHNGLPTLPPPVELETRTVLKACITARAALAELKQAAEMIPNQSILINTLPLLESQASSEIENIVTTTDKLFQHQHEKESADAATKEALRYSQSLYQGFRSIHEKPLNTRTAEEICTRIKGIEMKVRKVPGTALGKESGEVVYTPPVGEDRLRNLLGNWEQFLHNETEIDPLVRMAVGHYQFEAIHPFTDGNGRTGRVLNSLFLIHEGLLTLPILYLSRYIIENKADYYRLLLGVTTTQAWEPWVLFLLKGVEETSIWTKAKIDAILKLFDRTAEFAREHAAKAYSHELISLIFELPYCRIQNVVDMDGSVRQTAAKKLKKLVEVGILEEVASGREKLFIHPKLLRLLTRNPNSFSHYKAPPGS